MLELAIFDLGNVLYTTHFQRACVAWSQACGRDAHLLARDFVADEAYAAFERGEISPHRYYWHVCELLAMDISYEDFAQGWCAIYGDYLPGAVETIRRVKAHCPVVALTNTNAIHCQVWPERYADTLSLFDALYISSQMGVRKPERACFEHVLSRHNAAPAQAVFFDDLAANVAAARRIGLRAFQIQDPSSFSDALQALGL